MASATPDLRLPSQLQGITAHWLVPNYTAWWQRHLCVNNLPRVALDSRETGIQTRDLLIASPASQGHRATPWWCSIQKLTEDSNWYLVFVSYSTSVRLVTMHAYSVYIDFEKENGLWKKLISLMPKTPTKFGIFVKMTSDDYKNSGIFCWQNKN